MAEPRDAREWAMALFRRSVLKQRKLPSSRACSGPTDGAALPRPRLRQRRRQPAAARARRLVGLRRPDRRRRWLRSAPGRDDVHLVDGGAAALRRREPSTASRSWTCSSTCPTRRRSRASSRASRSRAAGWSSTRRTSSARCCGGSATRSARPTRSTATCVPATPPQRLRELLRRGLRARAPPHLLALLLGGRRHRASTGASSGSARRARPRAWS